MFPFSEIRPGQKEFVDDIDYALKEGKHLMAEAPTGIGKTAAVLSSVLDYAVKNDKIVFFVTPRHSQHALVVDTIKMINENCGQKIVVTDIIGKKWLCNQPAVDTLPSHDFFEYCRRMKEMRKCDFFNRTIKEGKYTKSCYACLHEIKKEPRHAEDIKGIASRHCPYELVLRLAKESNVIIGDYYHFFSFIRDQLLNKIKRELKDIILVVDEAHNLPDRARSLLSHKLTTRQLKYAVMEAQNYENEIGIEIAEKLDAVGRILKNMFKDDRFVKKEEFVNAVEEKIGDYFDFITEVMEAGDIIREDKRRSTVGSVANFLQAWSGDDEGFTRIISQDETSKGNIVTLFYDCLDPSVITKEIIDGTHSTILMSGTLRPISMYMDLLGMDTGRTVRKEYKSNFPRENRLNIIAPDVTTKYTERSPEQYQMIVDYINRTSNSIKGNVAVFFPSYYLRDQMMDAVETDKQLYIEEQGTTKMEKAMLYDSFVANKNALLLAVQAGSLSEGVDYIGDALNGVIVVGIALDRPTLRVQALIDYYNDKFGKGWEYAYSYPAILRALQTAGRCIRSETDRGVCLFLDKRYTWNTYRVLFPHDLNIVVSSDVERLIGEFNKKV